MQRVVRRVCVAAQSSRCSSSNHAWAAAAVRLSMHECSHRPRHVLLPIAQSQQQHQQQRRWRSSIPAATNVISCSDSVDALPATASATRKGARSYWNVHHEIVTRETPLPDVFVRLQHEKQLRTLHAASVRQAIDVFYFHCVQQASTLDAAFRQDVLTYFDTELFAPAPAAADDPNHTFVLGESLNEATFSAIIKLHLATGDAAAAWAVVDKLHAVAPTATLHFRTVGAILEHDCRNGAFASAFCRWQQLKQTDSVSWTYAMEDVLVQMAIACCRDAQSHDHPNATSCASHAFNDAMSELLSDLRRAVKEISPASAQRLRHAFHSHGYRVQTLASDDAMCPACPACGHALAKLDVTTAERTQLLRAIDARETKSAMSNGTNARPTAASLLAPFKQWLLAKPAPLLTKRHYVLDGPNIAYINQNFDAGSCRFDHIDAVAEQLHADGHVVSITMPFAYLADRIAVRIRTKKTKQQHKTGKFTTRARTRAEAALVAKWQARNWLFSCRTDCISDDLFWLYASVLLGRAGRVVTNDQGRDHVFALLNSDVAKAAKKKVGKNKASEKEPVAVRPLVPPPALISMDVIDRWKELSIVNIEIQHEELAPPTATTTDATTIPPQIEAIRLLHPLPFSRVPQATAVDHFHFPISSGAPPSNSTGGSSNNGTPASPKHARKKWLCVHRKAASSEMTSSNAQGENDNR